MTRVKSYGPAIVLIVTATTILFGGPYVARHMAWAAQEARIDVVRQDLRSSKPLADLSAAFREVGKVVEPSVVHIAVSKKQTAPDADAAGPEDPEDLLRKFFRDRKSPGIPAPDDEEGDPAPAPAPRGKAPANPYDVPQPYGNGSGWVYSLGGNVSFIITNNHVVRDADEITVKFFDKTTRKATVVGTDPQTDIAVLKINQPTELHPATLSKETVEQGDMVFAFGSPFQFEFSMSQGIVSGKGRRLGILGTMGYEDFIQTDAAINPGNSGGPLTNIYGEVIGMNTAIATRTGSNSGLGFAIPSAMIKTVVDQIIAKGKVSRGYLGVFIQDLDEKMAKSFGYKGKGVLVEDFASPDAPAAKAGLKPGDIITAVNGIDVATATELRQIVAAVLPDQTIKLAVFREGKSISIDVKLSEQPANADAIGKAGPGTGKDAAPGEPKIDTAKLENLRKLGLEKVTTITSDLSQRLGLDAKSGVLVQEIRPGSVAYLEGLRPGVVISQAAGKDITSVGQLAETLAKANLKDGVQLRLNIQGVNRYVVLALPE